nr:MAG TPA: hypothetical protein [Crassvirales sp.]
MVSRVLNKKKTKDMEKFYLKNGKEVQIGDTLTKVTKTKHPLLGEGTVVESVAVTEAAIPQLLKAGIIFKSVGKVVKGSEEHKIGEKQLSLDYYIEKLAKRLGWKVEKVYNYLNTIDSVYPAAAFSMVLREVAIELDKKYEDHIEKSPEIYVVSMFDGKITKANKAHIKNYRNFAAFRTVEDAKIACSIVREILKELFKSGK